MAPRSPWRRALVVAALVLLGVTGCASGPTGPAPEPLPAAPDLLSRSAQTMATVRSAAVDVQVDQALTSVLVRSANGKLTSTGEATGTAVLSFGGSPVEYNFAVTKGSLYLKGPTGPAQRLPMALAAGIYDPTAVLNPQRGIAALLRAAGTPPPGAPAPTTEAREDVNGAPAYRVRTTVDPNAVSAVVPGVRATNLLVWVDKATSRLVKAQLDVPVDATQQGGPTAPATVTFADFDAPVTVTPPS